MSELSGDGPLTRSERVRYMLHGFGEIAALMLEWRPAAPLMPVDLADPATATRVAERATPFRVYSTTWLAARLAEHTRGSGLVLDLGCGAGGLARFFGDTWRYLGLDLAPKGGWASPAAGSRFVAASVDAVVSSSALEHIGSVENALRESRRVLKPGGVALHAVPGPWSLLLYLFHGFRRFTPSQLVLAAEAAGFREHEVARFGGLASFVFHALWVTLPTLVFRVDLRQDAFAGAYAGLLKAVLRLDRLLPFFAVGYGLRCIADSAAPQQS